jgi:hypothetical protein
MAFDTGNNSNGGNDRGGRGNNDADWKADGFLNLSLPRPNKDGSMGHGKIGAIPLQVTVKGVKREDMATLVAWLEKDEANAQKLVGKDSMLKVDYQSAKPVTRAAFVLPE